MNGRHGRRGPKHGHRSRGRGSSRTRLQLDDGTWVVKARVEKMVEPAVLAAIGTLPGHGYELAEDLEQMLPTERIDMGNLYRLLRSMEEEELVVSEWEPGSGRGRRTYKLTESGQQLLAAWVGALSATQESIARVRSRSSVQLSLEQLHSLRRDIEADLADVDEMIRTADDN